MDLFLANPDYSDTAVTRLQKRMWYIPPIFVLNFIFRGENLAERIEMGVGKA